MNDLEALARYVHDLHDKLGRLLIRDLNDATDAWYVPHPGGRLEEYLRTVDEFAERFGIIDVERFYADRRTVPPSSDPNAGGEPPPKLTARPFPCPGE